MKIYTVNELLHTERIIVASGGFDPIHPGHISYLQEFMKICPTSTHYIFLNSDRWLIEKKGKCFMPFEARLQVIKAIIPENVFVVGIDDSDGNCCRDLFLLRERKFNTRRKRNYNNTEIIFCKGGDRVQNNIPEMSVEGISFCFGVGGGPESKVYSSSKLLESYENK
jgi:cytidyltransferase-like protein